MADQALCSSTGI